MNGSGLFQSKHNASKNGESTSKDPEVQTYVSKFTEALGSELVRVLIGPKRKEYIVHKKLLTTDSPFFKAALDGGFQEAKLQEVYLPEEEPEGMDVYLHLLYRGRLLPEDVPQDGVAEEAMISYYCLTQMLLHSADQRAAVSHEIACLRFTTAKAEPDALYNADIIAKTFRRTKEDDPLRLLVRDFAAISMAYSTATADQKRIWFAKFTQYLDLEELTDFIVDAMQISRLVTAKNHSQHVRGLFDSLEDSVRKTARYQIGWLKSQE